MAFSDYKSIAQVQAEYQTKYKEANFVQPANYSPAPAFLEELKFNQENIDVFASEAARCEAVIFPVLREVYKSYHQQMSLWVQKAIAYDNKLNGTPDYLISKRSALGKTMLEVPIIIVVEAKKNDFEQGWGQCLAELIAAAHINSEKIPVYGIVTDGKLWEFAQFMDNVLLKERTSYTVSDLPVLLGVTKSIFEQATASLAAS